MIVSFKDKATEDLYHGRRTSRAGRFPKEILPTALRKLDMVNAAHDIKDLRVPPGNRLEPLKGNYKGCHSIRVNDQWRVIFEWKNGNAHKVRLLDYHR